MCQDTGVLFKCSLFLSLRLILCIDGTAQLAREAIENPVNPRAHIGPDGRASLSSRVQANEHVVSTDITDLEAGLKISFIWSIKIGRAHV